LTPNRVATLEGDSTRYPYFKCYGKSLGDGIDDAHVKILKAKLTSGLKGTFKYGEFMATEIEFMGVKENGKAFEVVVNETAADLPGATASPDAFTLTPVPADNAIGVVVTDNIVLTFSNALKNGSEDAIILTTAAGVPVAGARTISSNRKVVTINPTASLSADTEYLVVVPNVYDIYGQLLADTVVSFHTAA
jgi:methionine-rich copper-binding protein CopC